jgi:hypothetical protein
VWRKWADAPILRVFLTSVGGGLSVQVLPGEVKEALGMKMQLPGGMDQATQSRLMQGALTFVEAEVKASPPPPPPP